MLLDRAPALCANTGWQWVCEAAGLALHVCLTS